MDIMQEIANTKINVVVRKSGRDKDELVRLGDIFSIDETGLSDEMAKQAGLYAYFAVQMAFAEYSHARATAQKDEEYANADEAYREELRNGKEKFTEAVVRSYVLQDEHYQNAIDEETKAKRNYRLLRALCNALEMRATMLQSLGAHLRHELDMTGMNIRNRSYQASISDVKKAVVDARAKTRT